MGVQPNKYGVSQIAAQQKEPSRMNPYISKDMSGLLMSPKFGEALEHMDKVQKRYLDAVRNNSDEANSLADKMEDSFMNLLQMLSKVSPFWAGEMAWAAHVGASLKIVKHRPYKRFEDFLEFLEEKY